MQNLLFKSGEGTGITGIPIQYRKKKQMAGSGN
jgi:hypothetical protein